MSTDISREPAPGDWDFRAIRSIPFARLETELLALYTPPQRSAKTYSRMRLVFRLVGELLGPDGSTADINPTLVSRFVATTSQSMASVTTHSLLASFRVICNYAKSQGYIRSTPWEFRKRWVKVIQPVGKKHHSREEVRAVLSLLATEAAEKPTGWARWRAWRLYALASLFCYTGVRKSEGINLQLEDIDLDGRMILLTERKGKTFKTAMSAQPIPIPEELVPILRTWMAMVDAKEKGVDRPPCPYLFPGVTRKGPWISGPRGHRPLDQMVAAGERAGVSGFTFLSLRHSFATMSEAWGLAPLMLQRILRHSSLSTQKHYRHIDTANMREAVKRISFDAPSEGGAS